MINEQIRDKEVRVIGENGEMIGVMSSRDAMKLAREAELDLVKIAPTAKPPVCKIVDYGKYRYELARKEKEAKKKQKIVELKEVRLSPNIEANDLNTKIGSDSDGGAEPLPRGHDTCHARVLLDGEKGHATTVDAPTVHVHRIEL